MAIFDWNCDWARANYDIKEEEQREWEENKERNEDHVLDCKCDSFQRFTKNAGNNYFTIQMFSQRGKVKIPKINTLQYSNKKKIFPQILPFPGKIGKNRIKFNIIMNHDS